MFLEYYIIAWILIGLIVTLFFVRINQKEFRKRLISLLILGMILGPFGILLGLLPRIRKKYIQKSHEKLDPYESRIKYLKLKEEFLRHKLEEEAKSKANDEKDNTM